MKNKTPFEPFDMWEDEWDDYYKSGMTANRMKTKPYTPRHQTRERKPIMKTLIKVVAQAFVALLFITGCLWLIQAGGDLLVSLLP